MNTLQYIIYTLLLQGFEGTKRDIDEAVARLVTDKNYDMGGITYGLKVLGEKGYTEQYTRSVRNKKQIVYKIGNRIDIKSVLQLDL